MSRIMLPQLPPEIIIEILARLPVKPLFRLKCVCKSWHNLISNNPQFAKLHLHYAKLDTSVNRYRFFLTTEPFQSIDQDAFCNGGNLVTRELRYSSIPIPPTRFWYIGSCNGLIAAGWKVDLYRMRSRFRISVWNPTTGDFRDLPAPDPSLHDIDRDIFSGFGYDLHLDDYKIVRGVTSTSVSSIKMEVFSLKANEWRSSQDLHTRFSLDSTYCSTNGFLHWLVDLEKDPDEKLGIFSFDLGEEKFLEMVSVVPDHITKRLSGLIIQGVGDNVWVCTNCGWNTECCEGWVMKRDGSQISWTKLYSFSRDLSPKCALFIDVVWIAKSGDVLLYVDGIELLLYNPEKKSSLQYDLSSKGLNFNPPINYIETLVSPNGTYLAE